MAIARNHPLWMIARQRVRKLARKIVYQTLGERPPYLGPAHTGQLREIKRWDAEVRKTRQEIEREDYVLNP